MEVEGEDMRERWSVSGMSLNKVRKSHVVVKEMIERLGMDKGHGLTR